MKYQQLTGDKNQPYKPKAPKRCRTNSNSILGKSPGVSNLHHRNHRYDKITTKLTILKLKKTRSHPSHRFKQNKTSMSQIELSDQHHQKQLSKHRQIHLSPNYQYYFRINYLERPRQAIYHLPSKTKKNSNMIYKPIKKNRNKMSWKLKLKVNKRRTMKTQKYYFSQRETKLMPVRLAIQSTKTASIMVKMS